MSYLLLKWSYFLLNMYDSLPGTSKLMFERNSVISLLLFWDGLSEDFEDIKLKSKTFQESCQTENPVSLRTSDLQYRQCKVHK